MFFLMTLREKGQGLVEYAFLLVLVAVVVLIALRILGTSVGDVFSNLITDMNTWQG